MMMERAKTAPAPETTPTEQAKPAPATASSAPAANASAEERVQDLERRLNDLGGPSSAPAPAAPAAAAKPKEAQTGKNNPLLKRIQAAQERARLAEQKEKGAKAAAAAEIERKKREEEEAKLRAAEEERIAKAQSALRNVAGRALEDKQKSILAQLEGKAPPAPAQTAAGTTAPEQAVPIMKTMDPPPPSFDSMKFPPPKEMQQQLQQPHLHPPPMSSEMVGHGMNSRVLSQPPPPAQQTQAAPPSFDFVEKQMMSTPVEAPPAPTAPEISPSAPAPAAQMDHLHGIMPVAPPLGQPTTADMPPPPSFAQFEESQQKPAAEPARTEAPAQDDDDVFQYDENGNPLSPEQRQAMLDEQRLLYESIMKEKAANDAAIANATADAFDLRSSSAAAAAMPGGTQQQHRALTQAMDSVGRDAAAGAAAASAEGEAAEGDEETELQRSRRMVKIGNNQMVALHGQDRTKKAIREGTAILVQCINCQNWMQVTDTATLMFCPVCQVVSPVVQQNEVMTKEEAIQLTMDRKLAEKLQAEAYSAGDEEEGEGEKREEGVLERFFGGIGGAVADAADTVTGSGSPKTSATSGAASAAQSDTWWNKISSVVGYGVESRERGDMGVTLPPGAPASQYPAERSRGGHAVTGISGSAGRSPTHSETQGLLSPVVDGAESSLPPARVAESKPLFSCIADSVSSATAAVFSTGEGDAEGNVHGVDSSSLLMTNAGRGVGDGAGDYSKLPDQE